ncbi:protein phosphatase CheZ [Nevskia soli]|uniref:protein phosphatase CheZ n=1 Tax=Nevskia soli TaxID=418856 RepID=UPI00068A6F21|nr:protein phosphatase CheZ [Nevskia soli]
MKAAESGTQRDDALYAGVARLTRSLHDNLRELGLDGRLTRFAGNDMPDACVRLDHVVKMTEEAAHRTLDLVDDGRAIADSLADVRVHLARLHHDGPERGLLEARLAVDDAEVRLRGTLTALAQAQEYQDLSGQMIRRVIDLVRNVEAALLELLGEDAVQSAPELPLNEPQAALPGPALPGTAGAADQGDADRLLASLGF